MHALTHTHTYTLTHIHLGAVAVTSGRFSDSSQSPTVSGVQCTGSETDLLSCSRSNFIDRSNCDTHDDAAVVCQSEYTLFTCSKYSWYFQDIYSEATKARKKQIGFMHSCTAIAPHNANSLNSKILSTTTLIKGHPNNVR